MWQNHIQPEPFSITRYTASLNGLSRCLIYTLDGVSDMKLTRTRRTQSLIVCSQSKTYCKTTTTKNDGIWQQCNVCIDYRPKLIPFLCLFFVLYLTLSTTVPSKYYAKCGTFNTIPFKVHDLHVKSRQVQICRQMIMVSKNGSLLITTKCLCHDPNVIILT